jgi:isopenicillin N synthase-like dioxygenase
MGKHTNFGSIAILVNRVGGLQLLLPYSKEWRYVRLLRGHRIINLGDAVVKFTNGLLRSNLHRLMAPPGEQVGWTRYAVAYFARLGDQVPLRRVGGVGGRLRRWRRGVVVEEGVVVRSIFG